MRAPDDSGNKLRENGWNLDQFPGLSDDLKNEKVLPEGGDETNIYYIEWADLEGYFETLYITNTYNSEHSLKS